MTEQEDLLSDVQALTEDIHDAITELSATAQATRKLVATSRRNRKLRTTTLRLVKRSE